MSRIDKLAILGVRSFDNTRSETIQFHTPLTLIVGYNGSGKTTIIECLKYATTGDLPPNSKGGAFIHDPKMCGEKEVLAQVKLSFKSTSDAKMVCTRSLQLTVKKTTRQQKTLAGQLLVVRNGERSTISSRCAELDLVMPQYLGVSKAVLEYVIFCHQDESLWPMSEPAVLKKRFDEIFEALKYTKAIDNIKVLRKRQNEDLGKLKLMLDQYRTDKDRGEKAKRRADELHTEIETMREKVEQLNQEISGIAQEQARLFQTAKGFEQTLATLEMKKQESQTKQSHIDELLQHMTELHDSDDDLLTLQRQYGQKMQTYEQHIENRRQDHANTKAKLEKAATQLNAKLTEQGRLQAERNAYEAELQERENTVREISLKYGIRGFDSELDSAAIDEFVSKMSKMSREQNLALERLKRDYREKTSKAQGEYNGILAKQSSLQQKRDYAISETRDLDQQIQKFQRELKGIGVDDSQEKEENTRLADKERRLEVAKFEFEKAGFDGLIEDARAKLRAVEERQFQIDEEFSNANKQVADRAKLDLLRKGIDSRNSELQSLIVAKSQIIQQTLGLHWSTETLQQDLQPIIDDREAEFTEAIRIKDGVSQKLSQTEAKLNLARDSLRKKQRELKRSEGIVLGSFDVEGELKTVEDYPKAAEEFEKHAHEKQSNLQFYSKYLKSAIVTLEQNSACHLCKRRFQQNEIRGQKDTFEKQLQKILETSQDDAYQELESDLAQIRQARPHYDSYMRLKETEIPGLIAEVDKYTKAKQDSEEELHKLEEKVQERREKRDEVKELNVIAAEMTKYAREIQRQEEDASDLSSSLTDIGGLRTMDDIKKDREETKEEYRNIQKELNRHQLEKEKKTRETNTYESQVKDSRIKLGQIGLKLEQSRSIKKRIEECKEGTRKQRAIVAEVEDELVQLAPGIASAEAKLKEISREGAEKERQQQLQSNKLTQSDNQLKSIQQKIDNYVDRGGLEQLQKCQTHVNDLETNVKQLDEEATFISRDVTDLEKESASAGQTERTIAENLRYRKNKRDLGKIALDIEELESQNAAEQRERFQRDADILSNRHMRLSSDKSALAGEMRSKDKQLEQLIQDFATDYADAKDKYRETLSKVKTMEGAMNDLGKYGAALDKAVMKYHTLKMEEINHIIEELWKATYRGTDVDTILIRSDSESARGNRSYNYRVCMVKQDAEMDMRGRCSAGQRVLACIIIRLALAECFGINCGLIALDEPTTNLDSDNIRSLARSLHEIINTRRAQANFQLIVITHDEDFLKEMRCEDYCDHYYRVSRNDRQKSIIERQSIAENGVSHLIPSDL